MNPSLEIAYSISLYVYTRQYSTVVSDSGQFVGVGMTDGLVDHFIEAHDGSECENNTES